MGIRVGICGAGRFATTFVPLFKAHPLVDEVSLAELFPERRKEQAARFGIKKTYESLEALCGSDVDAIAIFTQRHLHGPQAIQALRAGKHVYSAVPTAINLEEINELVQAVKETGLTYMLGETSYYYPCNIYCRRRFRAGDFGLFVYGEGEYYHDMTHGFYDAYKHSGGAEWKKFAGLPPMYYPTHSVSMILAVTGARMTQVSCLGFVDHHEDRVFRPEVNMWRNRFSNESALFRTSDGGMARINEFRRVGTSCGSGVRCSIYGTEASYEAQADGEIWVTRHTDRGIEDLREMFRCHQTDVDLGDEDEDMDQELKRDFFSGLSAVHPAHTLPGEFDGLPNGHLGSHQFLVDDFVKAVTSDRMPPNHVWAAAKYCAPGIVAHASALKEGELLKVPDFGDPPNDTEFLDERN